MATMVSLFELIQTHKEKYPDIDRTEIEKEMAK